MKRATQSQGYDESKEKSAQRLSHHEDVIGQKAEKRKVKESTWPVPTFTPTMQCMPVPTNKNPPRLHERRFP
jgi:hypothetical protein